MLLSGCVIYPEREVITPLIQGVVTDTLGNPVSGATVNRVQSRRVYETKYKYTSEKYIADTGVTDSNGMFILLPATEIDWWHQIMDLPFVWCYGDFEVTHPDFQTHKTEFGDFSFFNEDSVGCKGVKFEPKISLQPRY